MYNEGKNEFATLFQTIQLNQPLPIHGNTLPFHFSTAISSRYKPPLPLCHFMGILFRWSVSPQEYSPVKKSLIPHSSLHGNTPSLFLLSTGTPSRSPHHGNTLPSRSSLSPTPLSMGMLSSFPFFLRKYSPVLLSTRILSRHEVPNPPLSYPWEYSPVSPSLHGNILPFSSRREYSPVTKFLIPHSSIYGNTLTLVLLSMGTFFRSTLHGNIFPSPILNPTTIRRKPAYKILHRNLARFTLFIKS